MRKNKEHIKLKLRSEKEEFKRLEKGSMKEKVSPLFEYISQKFCKMT